MKTSKIEKEEIQHLPKGPETLNKSKDRTEAIVVPKHSENCPVLYSSISEYESYSALEAVAETAAHMFWWGSCQF
jgi:hypothetical protein